jgi:hypothetical protein
MLRSHLRLMSYKLAILAGIGIVSGFSARADPLSITFMGANTGVTSDLSYVLPYQLKVNGTNLDAVCYDIFDDVVAGQTWYATELKVEDAAATGQFSSRTDARAAYQEIGFLAQQTTISPQNQIDLQQVIWNVFAANTYDVNPGMQRYLDLLATPAFTDFDFTTVRFLEDVNQTGSGRVQAFVIEQSAGLHFDSFGNSVQAAPEPAGLGLFGSGLSALGCLALRRRASRA